MGILRKIAALLVVTAFFAGLVALFIAVMVVNQEVPAWFYGFCCIAALVFSLYYALVVHFLFTVRCGDCGSWNVWRNIFPQNTGEDYSINGLYHRRRATYCYKCHSDSNIQHWTCRDPFS
jgi:hypothetical protein